MNIAFFTISEVNPLIGGIEKVTYNLTKLFQESGIHVYSFCLQGKESDSRFILPKTKNRRDICDYIDRKVREHRIDVIIDQYGIGDYMSHDCLKSDVKIVRCIHYNIVENHISACLLKTLSVRRLKQSIMNILFWLNTPLRRHRRNKNLVRAAANVDKMLFLSPSYHDVFPDKTLADKLYAIPNVVSLPPIEDVGLNEKENILLFCGRIVHNPKNIIFLLHLWQKLYKDYPTWRMILCGDGEDRTLAEEFIHEHKLERIEITGYTNPDSYYKRAKILLHPSYTECFAMVVLEAMAWGCVPVVFDVSPGFHDMISNGMNGFIVDGINKSEYEKACRRLIDDDELCHTMANVARQKSSDFTPDKIKEKWIQLFNELEGV